MTPSYRNLHEFHTSSPRDPREFSSKLIKISHLLCWQVLKRTCSALSRCKISTLELFRGFRIQNLQLEPRPLPNDHRRDQGRTAGDVYDSAPCEIGRAELAQNPYLCTHL